MENLNDIKVGDKVIFHNSSGDFIEVVEKVTKTQIHTKFGKYRKSDGYKVGAVKWDLSCISKLTPEKEMEIKEKCRMNKIKTFVLKYNFRSLSFDKLERVYNILKEN